ncbi:unnamed protein product [Diatraea saccharalis]|uniref:FP protein C-terminal domain-containing protein n=1 Tax=Diatraea saccharalis TaxID=40085 RepID=A0A9N9QY16_9NEOP|nr:unnamed protein product [Diatraea saccharalis]
MSKTQRTPPKGGVQHVASEGDICSLDPENIFSYKSKRSKRLRTDNQNKNDEDSLKDELFTMLSNWKKDQDDTLKKLCSDITELKLQNSKIQSASMEMEKSMHFMSRQYDEIKDKLFSMERERKENMQYISILENKIHDMEKKLKSTVIEVRNIPLNSSQIRQETQQELCELFQKTCDAVKVPIQQSEIKDIYRVNNKYGTVLITDLNSVITKNKVLNAVREHNKNNSNNKLSTTLIGLPGPKTPIYINESLTKKDHRLFALARDTAKSLQYKYCWTNMGRIYMRKGDGFPRTEVKNEEDLEVLKKA